MEEGAAAPGEQHSLLAAVVGFMAKQMFRVAMQSILVVVLVAALFFSNYRSGLFAQTKTVN
ncbi:hypothetical protein [Pseudobacter ginsenosidimutans]|uniref:hypothetical protein n=1 Tax=Pseudobacter ginsenosidimutans TaxID=661488 RepID=UPI00102D8A84|nr:hypothetical protein [Pseudobacter ginsenosidimutans]QEC44298.1 hypothetical protein FSB84_22435 [Pseudobacter ginsenosidimutans]